MTDFKTRFDRVTSATDQADEPRLAEVYRARASQLAVLPDVASTASWPGLTVTVGSERICLPLAELAEVISYARCSRLPGAPPELLGVVNVRGRICSVIDLARLLGLVVPDDRPRGFVVLVRHGASELGLRVDQVDQIDSVAATPAADHDGSDAIFCPEYLKGWTADRVAILDVRAVLSHRVFQSRNSSGATIA